MRSSSDEVSGTVVVVNRAMGFGLLALVLFFWIIWLGPVFGNWRLERNAPSFISAEATFVSSSIRHKWQRWILEIEYEYAAEGHVYSSDKTRPFDTTGGPRSRLMEIASQFKADDPITIWIDPKEPTRSVIWKTPEPDAGSTKKIAAIVAIPILLLAIWSGLCLMIAPGRYTQAWVGLEWRWGNGGSDNMDIGD